MVAGCVPSVAPKLSKEEKHEFEAKKYVKSSNTDYAEALRRIGTKINTLNTDKKLIQPKNIGNTAGGNELPFNLTNMVINSVSELAGSKLIVAPYDPEYIYNDSMTGGKGSHSLPNILIGGSITEFDKDIEGDNSSINIDVLFSHGGTQGDAGAGMGGGKKLSRVVIDLYLLDYKTQTVIQGMHISNTIHVLELEKDRDFGFAMWGSGIGIEGRIERKQGFHKAIRNLVEYSILQLFGKYYKLPYWQLLDMPMQDQFVTDHIIKAYFSRSPEQQLADIDTMLTQLGIGSNNTDRNTRINTFISKYGLQCQSSQLDQIFLHLFIQSSFRSPAPYQQDTTQNTQVNAASNGSISQNQPQPPQYIPQQQPAENKIFSSPKSQNTINEITAKISAALTDGTALSQTVTQANKLEIVVKSLKKLSIASPPHQEQLASATTALNEAKNAKDKQLKAYYADIVTLGKYPQQDISAGLPEIQKRNLTSREKIIATLLPNHINNLSNNTSYASSLLLADFQRDFTSFTD